MAPRSRPVVDLAASCACGAVTLTVKGRIYAMFMCSCEDCQKMTGTGHSTVALAAARDVTVSGETRSFERPADSGATFIRTFCPTCGTGLHGQSSRASELRMLPVGLFGADAAWFDPNQLIFARSHREWDMIAADLPRHDTYRDKGEIT
jgi:hypothetical protein